MDSIQSYIDDNGIVQKKNWKGPLVIGICYAFSLVLIILGILSIVF